MEGEIMKYLLLFLITFSAYATVESDMNSMDRLRRRMEKCGYTDANQFLFSKNVIDSTDTVKRDCLISKTAQLDAEDVIANARIKRRKDRAFGDGLVEQTLDLMPQAMSSTDKLTLLGKLTSIMELLQLGDIDGAKTMITAEAVDTLFTQTLKDFLLSEINTYLGL